MPSPSASPTRTRRLGAVLLSTLFTVLLLEAVVRGYFALKVGPRVMLYGTPWWRRDVVIKGSAQTHLNNFGDYRPYDPTARGGYSKYFPHETKVTPSPDWHESYPVRINNQGFRGADFAVEKPRGMIRVLTLGSSSTFGYHDRDDETYPYYLGQLLADDPPEGRRVEVINFAIPHATSDNILAMFLAEGVPLAPDVVTLYEGANDSVIVERGPPGPAGRAWNALKERLLTVAFVNYTFGLGVESEAYGWSEELRARRSRAFLANVDALSQECRRRGIRLVLATQQMKSELVQPPEMKGLTYDAEVRLLEDKMARGEIGPRHAAWVVARPLDALLSVFNSPRVMLVHARMMHDLRAWAAAHPDVGFVDLIQVLDQDRDLLANWVHLRAEANRKIAAALAAEIRARLGAGPVALLAPARWSAAHSQRQRPGIPYWTQLCPVGQLPSHTG